MTVQTPVPKLILLIVFQHQSNALSLPLIREDNGGGGGGGGRRREKEKKLFLVLRPCSVLTYSDSRAIDIIIH